MTLTRLSRTRVSFSQGQGGRAGHSRTAALAQTVATHRARLRWVKTSLYLYRQPRLTARI